MLRHYIALALRNIAHTKLYAAISVTGLAIGFAAATLMGLYLHSLARRSNSRAVWSSR